MKRTNIDATQLELADTVVAIKRVSKTVAFLRSGCSWRQEWSCRCWYGQGC